MVNSQQLHKDISRFLKQKILAVGIFVNRNNGDCCEKNNEYHMGHIMTASEKFFI